MALKLGEGFVYVGLRDTKFKQELGKLKKVFSGGMQQLDKVARQAKIALVALGGGMALTVRVAANFEQSMARVAALTGETGKSFDAMRAKAMQLGRTTQFSASQAADAMGFFALAGLKSSEIIAAMPHTLNLAAAGQLDMATAADITTKILKGMKVPISDLPHAVDVLAKAFTTANTDLGMLGAAMKFVGPVAQATGKSLEEVTAVIQVMSNAGIQGVMAGTSLRNILSRLSGATKETNKVFDTLGISMQTAGGKMRPIADIVDDLNRELGKLSEADRVANIMRAFGQRAGPAMAALLGQGGDAIREFQAQLEDAGGTAERIAEIQMSTFSGSVIRLKSAAEGLAIGIGSRLNPAIRDIVDRFTAWTQGLAAMSDAQFDAALKTAAMTAKLLVLLAVLPKLIAGIKMVSAMLFTGGIFSSGIALAITLLATLAISFTDTGDAAAKGFGKALRALGLLKGGIADVGKQTRQMDKEISAFHKDFPELFPAEQKRAAAGAKMTPADKGVEIEQTKTRKARQAVASTTAALKRAKENQKAYNDTLASMPTGIMELVFPESERKARIAEDKGSIALLEKKLLLEKEILTKREGNLAAAKAVQAHGPLQSLPGFMGAAFAAGAAPGPAGRIGPRLAKKPPPKQIAAFQDFFKKVGEGIGKASNLLLTGAGRETLGRKATAAGREIAAAAPKPAKARGAEFTSLTGFRDAIQQAISKPEKVTKGERLTVDELKKQTGEFIKLGKNIMEAMALG